ncbi:hypothetical protein EVAR_82304_1 [Eumeta japonica]|uniref:Uncharacterized protein n=1 Tax=Eumeta variegata TaxID=151549 RepID=A0A4C1VYI1_EUMVA|nr:hypothetical protein EVAR_82304_1 [Eumeta japonica]
MAPHRRSRMGSTTDFHRGGRRNLARHWAALMGPRARAGPAPAQPLSLTVLNFRDDTGAGAGAGVLLDE